MPFWLWPLIQIAIKLGSPYLLKFIQLWEAKLPPAIAKIIQDLIDGLHNPLVSNDFVKVEALAKLKECKGVGCSPEVKSDN